jgi:MFS family permease
MAGGVLVTEATSIRVRPKEVAMTIQVRTRQPDRRDAVLSRLVAEGVLDRPQADRVLAGLRANDAPPGRRSGWWIEVLGYIGGGLILAGATTLVALSWDDLGRLGIVALLSVVLVALLAAGVVVAGGPAKVRLLADDSSPVRRRIVGVLFALTGAVAALIVGVAVDGRPEYAAPVAGLVAAAAGYSWLRTAAGLFATGLFSLVATATVLDVYDAPPLVWAAGFVTLGAAWVVLAHSGLAIPPSLAYGGGAALALIGGQQPMGSPDTRIWTYVITLAVAFACLALYRTRRQLVLLLAGVLGVTIAVPEAVWDVTNGAGGAAVILLVGGAVLLAASGIGLRVHRRLA